LLFPTANCVVDGGFNVSIGKFIGRLSDIVKGRV